MRGKFKDSIFQVENQSQELNFHLFLVRLLTRFQDQAFREEDEGKQRGASGYPLIHVQPGCSRV